MKVVIDTITGNLRHYPHGKRQGVTVMTPAVFLELYRKRRIR